MTEEYIIEVGRGSDDDREEDNSENNLSRSDLEERAKEAIKELVIKKAHERFRYFLEEYDANLRHNYSMENPRVKKWKRKLQLQAAMLKQVGVDPFIFGGYYRQYYKLRELMTPQDNEERQEPQNNVRRSYESNNEIRGSGTF